MHGLCHTLILRLAAVVLVALSCCSPVFCGEIHNAAAAGDLAKVAALLKDNPDLVSSRDKGALGLDPTPLHRAVWSAMSPHGHREIVELLLARGAEVNTRGFEGRTPLQDAASGGHKEIVELLLARGAEVNTRDDHQTTPLQEADGHGYKDVAELLRRHGAEDFVSFTGAKVHLRIILVDSRVDAEMVVEKLKGGGSFADLARRYSTDSTKADGGVLVMEMGALREEFQTALSAARPGGTTEIIELVNKGGKNTFALLHCDDIEGPLDTPLLKAAKTGDPAVQRLLEKGAKVNVADDTGRTPLTFAAEKGHTEIVRVLLAGHANVNAATEAGVTSLIYAASEGHADVVAMLLAAKARVNATTDSGHTALTSAAWNGRADVVRLLLTCGANANAAASKRVAAGGMTFSPDFTASANTTVINGVTALMFASEGGHADVGKLLVASGARVNAVATNGATALMFAAEGGHADVVKLLLAAGANVNAVAKNGDTALRLASRGDDTMSTGDLNLKLSGGPSKGYADTVRLLKAAGAK